MTWFTTLLCGRPHFVIGSADDPYLLRWYLVPRNRHVNIYLHKFLRSDDDRALHDHPWWFASVILHGGYSEITASHDGTLKQQLRQAPSVRGRGRGVLAYRPAQWRHRVSLFVRDGHEQPCWTLIVTGPKTRDWGFWCPQGFVSWQRFTDTVEGSSVVGRGCQ
jgi:hypothetical protein